MIKKASWLLLLGVLAVMSACRKTNVEEETPSKDATLTGTTVNLSPLQINAKKIFLLNEGGMGSNNATLDFLRVSDAQYITGAFKKMNPSVSGGLGDVGNDIAVCGDELWMVINNSGIVEVVSARDETEIAAIPVATPRNIAFDENYAYVTSWAGSYVTYGADYSVSDSKNVKGRVYRINLSSKQVEGSVEVGYQPEGIACYDGRLYVANSGGIASQLPPSYAYDNTLSIIDTDSFRVEKSLEVQVNLKNVYADGKGRIYVTTLGNYFDIHSGLYCLQGETVSKIADYVSISALSGDTLYCVGTETELDWSAVHDYKTWCVRAGTRSEITLSLSVTAPYGLCVLDGDSFLVADAGDYFNPGTLSCYHKNSLLWQVGTGVCPAHFALY